MLVRQTEQNFNSNIYNCYIDTSHEHNSKMITTLKNIEESILQKWVQFQYTSYASQVPSISNNIIQQLQTGVISVWKNDMFPHDKPQIQHFIIKLSGVWENDTECGLTYKFI